MSIIELLNTPPSLHRQSSTPLHGKFCWDGVKLYEYVRKILIFCPLLHQVKIRIRMMAVQNCLFKTCKSYNDKSFPLWSLQICSIGPSLVTLFSKTVVRNSVTMYNYKPCQYIETVHIGYDIANKLLSGFRHTYIYTHFKKSFGK